MLRLAAGRIQPESGTIVLDGKSINQWSGKERAQRISYLPQAIEAGLPFTVSELVRLGRGADQQQPLFTEEELFNILGLLPYRETPINQFHYLAIKILVVIV
jgi:iron complex transport system ATP-binding protein